MQKLKKNAVFYFQDNGWASLCNVLTPSVCFSRHSNTANFFFICFDHIVYFHFFIEIFYIQFEWLSQPSLVTFYRIPNYDVRKFQSLIEVILRF